jgi:DNA modification methylase
MEIKIFGKSLFSTNKGEVLLSQALDQTKAQSKYLQDFYTLSQDSNPFESYISLGEVSTVNITGKKPEEKKEEKKGITPKEVWTLQMLNDKAFKLKTDPEYVDKQLETFKEKLGLIKSEEYDMRRGVSEIASIVMRLENRKKYPEFAKFFEEYPYTTTSKINDLVKNHSNLKLGQIAQFVADMPKEAVQAMKEYTANTMKLCEKQAVYYIIVDTKGVILSGNMRSEALKQLGIEEVDVKVPNRELTEDERRAIVLESNRNDGTWDTELLPEFGQDVLVEAGFESMEIDTLMEEDVDEDDPFDADAVADQIKTPKAQLGDLYELGAHRLICGDSTSPEAVSALMGGVKADMVFSDPPFNMHYVSKDKGGILNDNMSEEKFVEFCEKFMARFKEFTKVGGVFYICSGYQSYMPFVYAMKVNGINFAGPIIWVKNSLGMGMNDYRHKHEMIIKAKKEAEPKRKKAQPILYGWNGGKHYFADTREEADVWNIGRRATNTMVHPTQKPLALINRALKNSSKIGESVLDLFGGSGSTLISAHKMGRKAYLCELDPKYVDAIIARYEALTHEKVRKLN